VVKRYHQRAAEELYDLNADPNELKNLAGDARHQARLSTLRAEVEAWMKEQGDLGRIYGEPRLLTDPKRAEPPAAKKKQ
jgi:N-sulfoglucosamine sulfohydrolase